MGVKYAVFDGVKDNSPKQRDNDWQSIAKGFANFVKSDTKDIKLWSPVIYKDGSTRGNANALAITALVLDFDEGHDPQDFLESWAQYEYVVHSTWSHTAEHPKWRAIFPFNEPIDAKEWRVTYPRLAMALGHGACDPSCKDVARIYYLPSCKPRDTDTIYHHNRGAILDPLSIGDPELPEQIERERLNGEGRPGDEYDKKATWEEILVPRGWSRSSRSSYNGQQLWVRPGKDGRNEVSARTGMGEKGDRFFCWSSSAGIPANTLLTKFGLLAHLDFGGSFKDCAKWLAQNGYAPPKTVKLTTIEGGAEAVEFPLTDLGNAERLIYHHGENLRYCHLWSKWLTWDGRRWLVDETGGSQIAQLAHQTVRDMQKESMLIDNPDKRQAMAKFSLACESKARISNMIDIAKTLRGIPVTPDELDRHDNFLNVGNGTIELSDTPVLRGHRREDMITKLIPINYVPDAKCPAFIKFIYRVLNADDNLVRYVWKSLGYSLTGSIREHVLNFCFGPSGNNGKSTLVEAMVHVFGDYACVTPVETLMVKNGDGGISNDIARLKGMRLVVAPETEDGKRLNEGLIKRLTGGDTISARFMRAEYFEFKPTFKMFMVGNHKPVIRGTDDAIWRRIALIPFEVTIPKEERDRDLANKLRTESEGILSWIIGGYACYRAEGLELPGRIEEASNEYRQESDILGAFLSECTERRQHAITKASKLYTAYQSWCKTTGEYCVTQTRFGRAMVERGDRAEKSRDGMIYHGIAILDTDSPNVYRGGE